MNIDVNNGRSIRKMAELGGESRDSRIFEHRTKEFTQHRRELSMLEMYYRLIVNTNYFREEAYAFLVEGNTYKQIIEDYGVHSNYLRNVIYNETKRLFADLHEDPLAMVLKKESTPELVEIIISRLEELHRNTPTRKVDGVKDLFIFDIESKSSLDREFNRNINEQDFKEVSDVMKYFVKPYQDVLVEQIGAEYLGYIVYLLQTKDESLTDVDRQRKKYLQMEWMLK